MAFIIFIYGIIIGSFLNVCIYRIPANKSIISPPSSCYSCGHRLSYMDMIPVIGYFIYGGKCRYCKTKYSIRYPLVELLNGLMYLLVFFKYNYSIITIYYSLVASILIVIAFIDIDHQIIPDRLNLFIVIISIFMGINYNTNQIMDKLYGFLFGFLLFLLIAVITNAMGGGDIKLMGALGLIFGLKGIAIITVISFVSGAILSVILIILKKVSRKDYIPFGPFISLAAVIYMLAGNEIIDIYIKLLF